MSDTNFRIIRVQDITSPELFEFTKLTDVKLRKTFETKNGLYLAESSKVIERALAAGHAPKAFLAPEKWLENSIALLRKYNYHDVPIYVACQEQLELLTGFNLHRGQIAAMHRPTPLNPEVILGNSSRVVVLDAVADHTNVGAIFRSCAALGADAVMLTKGCADPLYRRAVRVSMGAVLQVPWAWLPDWQQAGSLLDSLDFFKLGFALHPNATNFADFLNKAAKPEKIALIFGSEGHGMSYKALGASNLLVNIPMQNNVDSLNVATCAAMALWALSI